MTSFATMTSTMFEIPFRMFEFPFLLSAAFADALFSDRRPVQGERIRSASEAGRAAGLRKRISMAQDQAILRKRRKSL